MSDSQGNGNAIHELPRYANGRLATPYELDLIARAFGFDGAGQMNRVCAERDKRRAARKAADKAHLRPGVVKKAS